MATAEGIVNRMDEHRMKEIPAAWRAEGPALRVRVTRLSLVTGRATKCGPSALSAVTGLPTHKCAAAIRLTRADGKPVNGVSPKHLVMTAAALGHSLKSDAGIQGLTLAQWARQAGPGAYLLWTGSWSTSHYIAAEVFLSGRHRTVRWADSCDREAVAMTGRTSKWFGPRSRINVCWSVTRRAVWE